MSKKGIIQNVVVIVLGLAIIAMSVGYAAFDNSISIEGSTSYDSASWDVHLENPVKTVNSTLENDQILSSPVVNQAGTEVNFSVNMKKSDVYEFSVDVRNSGTLNARLSNYTLVANQNGANIPIEKVSDNANATDLMYEVLEVEDGEILPTGGISTKIIRVIASDSLSTDIGSYDFKFNITYVQNK